MTHLEASTMGRPDSISFADLRRKAERARRRRETVPCRLCGQLPTSDGHDPCLGLTKADFHPAVATHGSHMNFEKKCGMPS
jgi:hypothetical protein